MTLTVAGNDKIQIVLRNARQILGVVIATFPSFESIEPSHDCHETTDDVEELACEWRGIMEGLEALTGEKQNDTAWLLAAIRVSSHTRR